LSLLTRWLPRSLVGRVFALYSVTLLGFVGVGLGLFYHFEFSGELEDAQTRAEALAAVIQPTVSDSAVIGDDDTIARTLERAIRHSSLASVAYIDLKGHQVKAVQHDQPALVPPGWLTDLVAARLYDTNLPITVGGRDYGVLRLSFAPGLIAADLWRLARGALALALIGLVGGLVLIRLPLVHWLGHLGRLRSMEEDLRSGGGARQVAMDDNAPIEFRETFEVLNQAAESLQAQRAQAAVTLAAIGDAVLTLDADGRVLLANPAAGALFDRPVEALLRQPAQDLLPDAFGNTAAPAWQAWRGRRVQRATLTQEPRVLDTTLSSILGPDGVAVGHVLACRDVTEEHRLEQRLREELAAREAALRTLRGVLEGLSTAGAVPRLVQGRPLVGANLPLPSLNGEVAGAGGDIEAISLLISGLVSSLQERSEQLKAIFALSPDGFVSFDAQRCVSFANPAFERLTGLEDSAVLGLSEEAFSQCLARLCDDQHQGQMPTITGLRRALVEGADEPRRALIQTERPARRVLQAGLRLSGSALISQVFTLRDVTHETEVDQMKTEFLSTAAHELRTPMASIFGFCELLMVRRSTPERQQEMLAVMHRQSRRMVAILDELLDLARIESRRGTDFELVTLDLVQLVHEVVHEFKPPGDRAPPQLPALSDGALVRVDRNKMHQALGNVLSNAYKYSPEGGPVTLRLVSDAEFRQPDRPVLWGICVKDHGIGLTAEQLARVGERFYRADASGNIPGTGLGMAIVKEILELLGGRLQIDSQPGQGSQVTLWLPLAERRQAATAAAH
jgi:signal transduction histidine kinase